MLVCEIDNEKNKKINVLKTIGVIPKIQILCRKADIPITVDTRPETEAFCDCHNILPFTDKYNYVISFTVTISR